MDTFKKRLPNRRDVFLVLGVVIFCIHSWAVRAFLFKVPSFLLYMDLGEIGSVFAYMMAFALLESALVTFAITLPAVFLPAKWYRDGFVYKASLLIFVGAAASILFQNALTTKYLGDKVLLLWLALTLAALAFLLVLAHFVKASQKFLVFLAEQISVMTYIYVPVGIVSIFVVIFRNILSR